MQKEYAVIKKNLPNHKFKFEQKYEDPMRPKHYLTASVTLEKDTKQAWNTARNILASKIKGKLAEYGKSHITLQQLYKFYKDHYDLTKPGVEHDPSYQTYYIYQSHLNLFFKTENGQSEVEKLTVPYFRKYFDSMQQTKSYSYTNVRRAALFHLFNFGIEYGYTHINPLIGFKLKRQRKQKLTVTEDKYLTDKEYAAILNELKKKGRNDYINYFKFLYYTGMRYSEASGVKVKDVYKVDNKWFVKIDGILIRRHDKDAVTKYKKRRTTKSDSGMRIEYLPPAAVDIYFQNKAYKNPNDFLFLKKGTHTPFSQSDIDQMLTRIAERVGIKKSLHSHLFRHTHVSKLAELGISLEDIKKRIGHEDAKITEEIYYHITEAKRKKLENNIDKL